MIKITKKDIEAAKALVENGTPEAAGYRLIVKTIDVSEKVKPDGVIIKAQQTIEKETLGNHYAILVHKGPSAFTGPMRGPDDSDDQYKEGDVLIFDRYAGIEVELPPGSGDKYRFVNDQNVIGIMRVDK